MYQDVFTKLEAGEASAILEKLNPEFDGSVFEPDQTTVLASDLAFYPGYRLLDIADYSSVPAFRRFVVYKAGEPYILNWTNEPIYEMNKAVPIKLTKKNVADYVRFFFSYVRGRHGRFIVTENVDDISWKDDPTPAARKAIGKMIVPLSLKGTARDGTFELEMSVMFKDGLFRVDVLVAKDGTVSLENEELLVEDMPVLDDVFGQ
ncbi:MAG: hypothetical protein R3D66_00120 [Alphaproteobacteria bacterium]|nr:hypothetical protein [Alphaproteobacteria bacterium]